MSPKKSTENHFGGFQLLTSYLLILQNFYMGFFFKSRDKLIAQADAQRRASPQVCSEQKCRCTGLWFWSDLCAAVLSPGSRLSLQPKKRIETKITQNHSPQWLSRWYRMLPSRNDTEWCPHTHAHNFQILMWSQMPELHCILIHVAALLLLAVEPK